MRKYISFAILMAFMSLAFSSCSKDGDEEDDNVCVELPSVRGYLVNFTNSSMDDAQKLLAGEWVNYGPDYDKKGREQDAVIKQITINDDGSKLTITYNDGTTLTSNILKKKTDGEQATIITDNVTHLSFKRIVIDQVVANVSRSAQCGVVLEEFKQPTRYLVLSREITQEESNNFKSTFQTTYEMYYTLTAFEAYFGIKPPLVIPKPEPLPQ